MMSAVIVIIRRGAVIKLYYFIRYIIAFVSSHGDLVKDNERSSIISNN